MTNFILVASLLKLEQTFFVYFELKKKKLLKMFYCAICSFRFQKELFFSLNLICCIANLSDLKASFPFSFFPLRDPSSYLDCVTTFFASNKCVRRKAIYHSFYPVGFPGYILIGYFSTQF